MSAIPAVSLIPCSVLEFKLRNALRKTGEGTLRICHVDEGTLSVNGRINGGNFPHGSMTVHNGATLGGNGMKDSFP